ncbi:ribonuclease H family protein [Bifidobacterium samirii]|uniref:ribonuclease H n=1 Tax=Bifidobacterium samirii TaxID=2306974 RepID=A0A430FWX6_9BIFI|nr:ribonuclease H [Bifidobacterium samirii]RSX58875.1 ribonuclease H [Bifidobacterium samirii]
MTITVSTDGSALGNPNGPMGWAWADHTPHAGGTSGHLHGGDCDAGGATNGTNQIGELCAVLEALRAHPGDEPLVIETDSQYAINCSTKWVAGWKRNGWKNSQKKPVKNRAVIEAIDVEIRRRRGSVRFVWVKGHAGNAGNEKVDELARTYAEDCRSGARDGYLPKEGWESLLASEYSKGTDVPEDARMLLDGRISAADYHLGRGGESFDDAVVIGAERPAGDDRRDDDARTDGVARDDDGIGDIDDVIVDEATGVIDDVPADGPTPDTADDAADNAAHHAAEAADADADAKPTEATAPAAESTVSQPAPTVPTAPTATVVQQTAPAMRASGLTVSGRVRVSPPPSSSPTFDGRPRMVRGFIEVAGYVDGDGTLTLADAALLM